MKSSIFAAAAIALVMAVPAYADSGHDAMCASMGNTAYLAAQSRDKGQSLEHSYAVVDSIDTDPSIKETLKAFIEFVYSTPMLTPEEERASAIKACQEKM